MRLTALLLSLLVACSPDPDNDGDGYAQSEDCDDSDANIHPDASEVCDGIDNDCNDEVDEGALETWFADNDGDGYGSLSSVAACTAPAGYVGNDLDCDDAEAQTNPGSYEICDGIDNDCDDEVDGSGATDAVTWYQDQDGDGFGDPEVSETDCEAPAGYIDQGGDCDDNNSSVHPDAADLPDDGIDQDCDGADRQSYHLGNDGPLSDTTSFWSDFLLGAAISPSKEGVLTHLAVYGYSSGGSIKLALYEDDGGEPGALIVATGAAALHAGAVEVPVSETWLAPGDYWLMAVYNGDYTGYSEPTISNTIQYWGHSFADPMPDPFGSTNSYTGSGLPYYLVLY